MDATAIRHAAHALGFDLVGITTADPPLHAAAYRQWIADGCHGEMRYMTRRLNPEQILPGCRSIIVVGLNYHNSGTGVPPVSDGKMNGRDARSTGRIARYVGERDYHNVMGGKLKELAKLVDGLW